MFVSGRAKLWYDHIRRLGVEGKGPLAVHVTTGSVSSTSTSSSSKIDEDKVEVRTIPPSWNE